MRGSAIKLHRNQKAGKGTTKTPLRILKAKTPARSDMRSAAVAKLRKQSQPQEQ